MADLQHVIGRLLDPDSAPVPPLELLVREELDLAARRTGVETHLELPPAPLPELAPAVAETAYRLVQEAISNAVTHGGRAASRWPSPATRGLSVTVDDDGAGFDVPAAGTAPAGGTRAGPARHARAGGRRRREADGDEHARARHARACASAGPSGETATASPGWR